MNGSILLCWLVLLILSVHCKVNPLAGEDIFTDTIAESRSFEPSFPSSSQWSSLRPGRILGMRTAYNGGGNIDAGIMWHDMNSQNINDKVRFELGCREDWSRPPNSVRASWKFHNGISYGEQEILDSELGLRFKAEFIAERNDDDVDGFVLRVSGSEKRSASSVSNITFVFYLDLSELTDVSVTSPKRGHRKGFANGVATIEAESKEQGIAAGVQITHMKEVAYDFTIPKRLKKRIPKLGNMHFSGSVKRPEEFIKQAYINVAHESQRQLYMKIASVLAKTKNSDGTPRQLPSTAVPHVMPSTISKEENVYFLQIFTKVPFSASFVVKNVRGGAQRIKHLNTDTIFSSLDDLDEKIEAHRDEVRSQMEDFVVSKEVLSHLPEGSRAFLKRRKNFVREILSDVLGGIGFFRGRPSLAPMEGEEENEAARRSMQSEAYPLLASTPSRYAFPRGFLWDEGFHELLISKFNSNITAAIISYWLSSMNEEGWIVREQILEPDSVRCVPAKFVPQKEGIANPPTLTFPINKLIGVVKRIRVDRIEGNSHMPKQDTSEELADVILKKTKPLLNRWFQWFLRTQRSQGGRGFQWRGRDGNHTLASGLDDYPRVNDIQNPPGAGEQHLDVICWLYAFSGTSLELAKLYGTRKEVRYLSQLREELIRDLELHYDADTGLYEDIAGDGFVRHVGYVTLFPFIFGMISEESGRLQRYFEVLRDPELLWSPFGVRSLSTSDPQYGSGENYWRGPIWINMNYLILASLRRYSQDENCAHAEEAADIYNALRRNVLGNVMKQYEKTGYLWEQYDPADGSGRRNKGFTGWTSLVLLILLEDYEGTLI